MDLSDSVSQMSRQGLTRSVTGTSEHPAVCAMQSKGKKRPHTAQKVKPDDGSQPKYGKQSLVGASYGRHSTCDESVGSVTDGETRLPKNEPSLILVSPQHGKSSTSPAGVNTRKQKLLAKLARSNSRTPKISPRLLRSSSRRREMKVD